MKLNQRARHIVESIASELAKGGIYQFNVEQRRKHAAVVFTLNDTKRSIIFSTSPSDDRAADNSRKHVRLVIRETTNLKHQ